MRWSASTAGCERRFIVLDHSSKLLDEDKAMRWEYKLLEFKKKHWLSGQPNLEEMQAELTNLGRQGWELIDTTKRADSSGFSVNLLFIFKKPIQ